MDIGSVLFFYLQSEFVPGDMIEQHGTYLTADEGIRILRAGRSVVKFADPGRFDNRRKKRKPSDDAKQRAGPGRRNFADRFYDYSDEAGQVQTKIIQALIDGESFE